LLGAVPLSVLSISDLLDRQWRSAGSWALLLMVYLTMIFFALKKAPAKSGQDER
jgi:hypothetical protein